MNATENEIIPYTAKHEIEPYGVFRRSAINPIFHPYYINYGYDKIEFFNRIGLYHSDSGITQ